MHQARVMIPLGRNTPHPATHAPAKIKAGVAQGIMPQEHDQMTGTRSVLATPSGIVCKGHFNWTNRQSAESWSQAPRSPSGPHVAAELIGDQAQRIQPWPTASLPHQ